jgi:hypothetical protein
MEVSDGKINPYPGEIPGERLVVSPEPTNLAQFSADFAGKIPFLVFTILI